MDRFIHWTAGAGFTGIEIPVTTYEENPPLENPELNVWDDIDRI